METRNLDLTHDIRNDLMSYVLIMQVASFIIQVNGLSYLINKSLLNCFNTKETEVVYVVFHILFN